MYGKPYHKMDIFSWMIPGGNREHKRTLMEAKKYPMKSAIQKNLGGPLSEVFFSSLTQSQKDLVGYTPALKGPGNNLWVSPSNIVAGKVKLTPPYPSRLRQALTHQGVLELGAYIETKFVKNLEYELDLVLKEREKKMKSEARRLVEKEINNVRLAQQFESDFLLQQVSADIKSSYQEVLEEAVTQALAEGTKKLENTVEEIKKQMENELCHALKKQSEQLGKSYEFQLAWRESELREKYENQIKKNNQRWTVTMEKAQREFVSNLKRIVAQLEAQHITDMLIHACERSKKYHEEKMQLEDNFGLWFTEQLDEEVTKRDFEILELENSIRSLTEKCELQDMQLKVIFEHFQKFINCALKEKPGQAEYLLSLEEELRKHRQKVQGEENEFIAGMIIEYIIKIIDDSSKADKIIKREKFSAEYTLDNFREKIENKKENQRKLQLLGEETN